VLLRPGRARTSRTRTPAALRFASLRRVIGSLQALSDTPSAVSIARPPPHPPLMRGTDALKTSGDRDGSTGT